MSLTNQDLPFMPYLQDHKQNMKVESYNHNKSTMQIYQILEPIDTNVPIIVSIPHSGELIPNEVSVDMNQRFLKALYNTDWYLDKLYDFLPELGVTTIIATNSRYVVDLNRSSDGKLYGKFFNSLVAQETALNEKIYDKEPNEKDLGKRVKLFYEPYHKKLDEILKQFLIKYDKVYLLDLHSFMGPLSEDICLGNVDNQSCSSDFINFTQQHLEQEGFNVVQNKVYKGGYITRHYSQLQGVETLQIELRYTNYLNQDELDLDRKPQITDKVLFQKAKNKLKVVFQNIINHIKMQEDKLDLSSVK